jgi:hypothetical protein
MSMATLPRTKLSSRSPLTAPRAKYMSAIDSAEHMPQPMSEVFEHRVESRIGILCLEVRVPASEVVRPVNKDDLIGGIVFWLAG